jgi:hypothetical protein
VRHLRGDLAVQCTPRLHHRRRGQRGQRGRRANRPAEAHRQLPAGAREAPVHTGVAGAGGTGGVHPGRRVPRGAGDLHGVQRRLVGLPSKTVEKTKGMKTVEKTKGM